MASPSIMAPLKKRKLEKTTWQDEMMEADADTLREARDTINDLLSVSDTVEERDAFAAFICKFGVSCDGLRKRVKDTGIRAFYYERLAEPVKYKPIPCTIDTFEEFYESAGCWCGRDCCLDETETETETESED